MHMQTLKETCRYGREYSKLAECNPEKKNPNVQDAEANSLKKARQKFGKLLGITKVDTSWRLYLS